jgi:uncharacterized protein YndB with AHSA1/START domain
MARQPFPQNEALTGFATSPRPGVIRLERAYPASAEAIWSHLTESSKRRDWWAAGNMDLRKDGLVDLIWYFDELSPFEQIPPRYASHGGGHRQSGRITKIEAPRILAFTWGEDSEVTFEIEPRNDGAVLVVTHRRLEDRPEMIRVASGWFTHMLLLEDALLGRERRPFWYNFSLAELEHEKLLGEPPFTIQVSRRFKASPAVVFDAWLAAGHARLWMFADKNDAFVRTEHDPQSGGRFILTDHQDGTDVAYSGTYSAVVRPRRIAFNFGVLDFSPELDRVTLDIAPAPNGAEIVLVHEMRPVWTQYSDRAEAGWIRILAKIAASIEGKTA